MKPIWARVAEWFSRPGVRLALGLGLGLLLLGLIARQVELAQVGQALLRADLAWVAAAQMTVFLSLLFRSLRWQILLGPGQAGTLAPTQALLLPILLVGQLLNALMPTRLGDVSRAYGLGRAGFSRSFVLGTVVVEKLWDGVAYGLLLLLLLALIPLPAWARPGVISFVGVMALLLIGLLLAGLNRGRLLAWLHAARLPLLPAAWQGRLGQRLAVGMVSLDVMQRPATSMALLLWSLLIWGAGVTTNYLLFLALGMALPPAAALLLLIVLQISVTLPPSPGNIGIFEALCVLTLAVFGVDATLGLSYGLLLHGVVFLPTSLLGIYFVGRLGLWGGARP